MCTHSPGVLPAVVPALAVGDLLGGLANVAIGVVNLALGTSELVGLLPVEAGEEELKEGKVCNVDMCDP